MPIYDYKCPFHGEKKDIFARMDEVSLPCPECSAPMERLIAQSNIQPDWEPYWEENMGPEPVLIKSRQHWKQELAERGLICRG